MAYLNVRERRIEATIAYVGSELSGKATNFEHVRRDAREGRAGALDEQPAGKGSILSFDWRPLRIEKFNDCDVMVKLVTTHGLVSADDVQRVLEKADGIVFVADADPAALDRNKRSLATVRDWLARDASKKRPIVVQVNKRDLPDATPAGDLASALAVQQWPQVSACATNGEGVLETLLRALDDVLSALKETKDDAKDGLADPRGAGPRPEGNPLLTALRQVLQSTVAEHVAALEERMARRLEDRLAELAKGIATLAASSSNVPKAVAPVDIPPELRTMPAKFTKFEEELAALERGIHEVQAQALRIAQENARTFQAIEDSLSNLASFTEAARHAAGASATKEDVNALDERLRTHLETRGKLDREHVTSTATLLRKQIEGVAADVKGVRDGMKESSKTDASARIEKIAGSIEILQGLLEPTLSGVRALPPRLNELEARMQKDFRESLARWLTPLDESIRNVNDSIPVIARLDERSEVVVTGLTELITELKQRKKGWFS